MPTLSIIVPIYNVEKYLARCIDSILCQDYTDFELILIDDGSSDHCSDIMRQYASKDERIILIFQENKGVSAARNAGIKIARGQFLGFVDADDWIRSSMYSSIIPLMIINNTQLGIVGFERKSNYLPESLSVEERIAKSSTVFMDKRNMIKELFHVPQSIAGYVWNKVFRRDHIRYLFDEKQHMCEDEMFVLKYIESIDAAIWIRNPLYCVYLREGSVTRSDPHNYLEALYVKKQMCNRIKNSSLYDLYDYVFKNYFDTCIRVLNMQPPGSSDEHDIKNRVRNEICEMLNNSVIKPHAKLKYLYSFIKHSNWLSTLHIRNKI